MNKVNGAAPVGTMANLNPTSATFKGVAKDGAIVFQAINNTGVREEWNGCAMVSMTVQPLMKNQVSLKWTEEKSASRVCDGGEMAVLNKLP